MYIDRIRSATQRLLISLCCCVTIQAMNAVEAAEASRQERNRERQPSIQRGSGRSPYEQPLTQSGGADAEEGREWQPPQTTTSGATGATRERAGIDFD